MYWLLFLIIILWLGWLFFLLPLAGHLDGLVEPFSIVGLAVYANIESIISTGHFLNNYIQSLINKYNLP